MRYVSSLILAHTRTYSPSRSLARSPTVAPEYLTRTFACRSLLLARPFSRRFTYLELPRRSYSGTCRTT